MPEGAEVKIIGEGLARLVSGKTLTKVVPLSGRYLKKPVDGFDPSRLPAKVIGTGVKGKLIFWLLDNDTYILNTLGMTGGWSKPERKHSRVRFEFDNGECIHFNDVRNFGTIKFIKGRSFLEEKLNTLGPDMLSENVTDEVFRFSLERYPDKTLPEVLMNQNVICGVGNYVKAESLWRARLSPHRLVGSLNQQEMSKLNSSIKEVLRQAYADQGASLRDYKNVDEEKGEATLKFAVYGCKTDPHGNKVVKEETLDGRVTHWSPNHQH